MTNNTNMSWVIRQLNNVRIPLTTSANLEDSNKDGSGGDGMWEGREANNHQCPARIIKQAGV